jgi:hypothetical protein
LAVVGLSDGAVEVGRLELGKRQQAVATRQVLENPFGCATTQGARAVGVDLCVLARAEVDDFPGRMSELAMGDQRDERVARTRCPSMGKSW